MAEKRKVTIGLTEEQYHMLRATAEVEEVKPSVVLAYWTAIGMVRDWRTKKEASKREITSAMMRAALVQVDRIFQEMHADPIYGPAIRKFSGDVVITSAEPIADFLLNRERHPEDEVELLHEMDEVELLHEQDELCKNC
jgi:hypothetical protein